MRRAGLALCGVFALLPGSPAVAQGISPRLPTLAQVKPLPPLPRLYRESNPGFLHDFKLSVEAGYSLAEKRRQPTRLRQSSVGGQLGLSLGVGQIGFASFTGSYSRENIKSTILAFPLSMDAGADALGFDAVFGIAPVPFLRAGVLAGVGSGSSSYQFVGVAAAPVGAKSGSFRYGGFVGATYASGRWSANLDAAILASRHRQEYDPTNIPPVAHFGSTIGMLTLSTTYDVTMRLRLLASLTVNQVFQEKIAPAERGLDKSWFTAQIGTGYMLTERWEVTAKGTTWLSNQRMRYSRATLGASYKF